MFSICCATLVCDSTRHQLAAFQLQHQVCISESLKKCFLSPGLATHIFGINWVTGVRLVLKIVSHIYVYFLHNENSSSRIRCVRLTFFFVFLVTTLV